jgi:hypothetical protein
MSSDIANQIAKDAEIISQGRPVEWHFYTSPATGLAVHRQLSKPHCAKLTSRSSSIED